jgi:hypothetical protein
LDFRAKIESESGNRQFADKSAIERVTGALATIEVLLEIPDESLCEDVGLAIELISDRI